MASILSVGEIQGLQENSNVVTVPSGHELSAPGHVVQIAEPSLPWANRWSSTSSSFAQTPHEVSITPKYANSKIKIDFTFNGGFGSSTTEYLRFYLYRNIGGTRTPLGETSSSNGIMTTGYSQHWFTGAFHYIDTPSTTSPITYEVWAALYYGSGNTGYLGWSSNFNGSNGVYMSAMEIAQ